MKEHNIRRANLATNPSTLTLRCLAVSNGEEVSEVEVCYDEGPMRTDLAKCETIQSILRVLGCAEFYLTIHTRPLSAKCGFSVLQPWVEQLSLRHQGVLMACVRGCDSVPKEDATKALARCLRAVLLVSFDPKPTSFIEHVDDDELQRRMVAVLMNNDHYPVHFIMHLIQGSEVVGYKHPHRDVRKTWHWFYVKLAHCFHLNIENEEQLDSRLGACEAKFAARAKVT